MYKTQFIPKPSHFFFGLFAIAFLLAGCSNQPIKAPLANQPKAKEVHKTELATAYDYDLVNQQLQPISLKQLITELKDTDIVFIGEFHGNHASALLEMQVLAGLYQQSELQNQNIVLSMEMFNRDQQEILNQYLDSEIGEVQLIKEAPAWNNYVASYRPLVEFAKQRFVPVVAANAAADIVRCVGREGQNYISKLTPQEKSTIAKHPFAEIPGYKNKFASFLGEMRHLPENRKNNSYSAQITRDNTMAESIYQAWLNHPNLKVVHINGSFHSENHLGTVAALHRLDPKLKIKVITPIRVESTADISRFNKQTANAKDDYLYFIKPQPEQYVDAAYKMRDRRAMFKRSDLKSCK
ncbi:ChaN family lipoprotein [Thiomicrorhabdus sp.]|uniref:ChaN family lipoprotein n=1 Tax=Thiomicrorhabdus sp. TaxID=2039724 RepID=UPI002AA67905|nr:ChaN family lipoprotein [Thiomicrorhabdus sp.]